MSVYWHWLSSWPRDHAQGSRRRSASPSLSQRKQRKRGEKHSSGRGRHRRKMSKADRLSERYFRICWQNCASANRRGAALKKTVYHFDVVCPQETRTCPNRPHALQDFPVIHRHQGCGMAAAVVWSDLSKTVSSPNLDKWCTNSREPQGIQTEKPNERHTSLTVINVWWCTLGTDLFGQLDKLPH